MDFATFNNAKKDLYILLNRGYPKPYALRFVGDHHGLNKEERHILSRIVFPKKHIEEVKRKRVHLKDLKGNSLFIDGYNVIITAESVLMKKAFVSMDGLLRDTRGVSKKHKITDESLRSIELILLMLKKYSPSYTQFYLDKMVSKSGVISKMIRERVEELNIEGDSKTVTSVDQKLKNSDGIIATNDSVIISKVDKFIDLPSKIKISKET